MALAAPFQPTTNAEDLRSMCREIRRTVLQQSKRAGVGHIASALSVADIVGALYGGILRIPNPAYADRDRFVLSKGHAALSVYAALRLRGWLTDDDLNTYCSDGTLLTVHPEHELPGVDFSTGSLGQGLSMGAGAAVAARIQGSWRRSFVLMSDAECNEGSVWEAVMFAAHHHLSNLVVIVDLNGQQALGFTKNVIGLGDMTGRWKAFGWDVREVDGHDPDELSNAVSLLDTSEGKPHVIVAHTVAGKGVSYMEGKVEWHYLPMRDDQYLQALREAGSEA